MTKKLNKLEKGLLLGFTTNLLSERTHNHLFKFLDIESGLSRKHLLLPLLEVVRVWSASNNKLAQRCHIIDEITLSDDDDNGLTSLPSILPCNDEDFFSLFHIKKSSLEVVEEVLQSLATNSWSIVSTLPDMSPQLKILMTIWILNNQRSYSEAAEMFNVSPSDCEACFITICSVLAQNISRFITWPSVKEVDVIANSIDGQFGFPGVVGIIGSAKIKSSYPNQISKDGCCVLQVVCDHNTAIRDITLGPAGVDCVTEVFYSSTIYKKLMSKKQPLINAFKHIIGSNQYPQLAFLQTPYQNEVLTSEENQFNVMHESVRQIVDRCFHTLVARFTRLQFVVASEPDHINIIVMAACCLHNVLLQEGDKMTIL